MQVCLWNTTSTPILVKEINMTVGANQKSRVLMENERVAIVGDYPGLRFIDVLLEEKLPAKPVEIEIEVKEVDAGEGDGTKTKRKLR